MISLPSIAGDQYGVEPYIVVKVQWVPGGQIFTYKDQLISISQIDAVIQISNNSDSQSVSLVISDTDSFLRNLMDTVDINRRPVWIYLGFVGDATLTLLFKGDVSSPISWSEGARQLSFTVLSRVEDTEVGFSAEQNQFSFIPDTLVGVAWPLGFGYVCKYKALKVTEQVTGTTLDPFGIPDPSLVLKLSNMRRPHVGENCPKLLNGLSWMSAEEISSFCSSKLQYEIDYAKQCRYATASIRVENGHKFPQNIITTITINDGDFEGYFSGDVFYFRNGDDITFNYDRYVLETAHKTEEEILANSVNGTIICITAVGCATSEPERPCKTIGVLITYHRPEHPLGGPRVKPGQTKFAQAESCRDTGIVSLYNVDYSRPEKTYSDYETFGESYLAPCISVRGTCKWKVEEIGYFEAGSGSQVTLAVDEPIDYVINLIGAINITVCAKIKISDGVEKLVGIPVDWYTIFYQNIGPYTSTFVRLKKPLARYDERFVGEDIFVSYDSEIGPNAVDIIEWLIETYSELTVDAVSFAAVKAKVACYPVGFVLTDKRNLVEVIRDIAYQSRCYIYLKNGVFDLKYASETPSSVYSVNSLTNVHTNTLELNLTPSTEELTTKVNVTWQDCENSQKVVIRNNVAKYGLKTRDDDYYIHNDVKCVIKTATFWLIRDSNTWKEQKFTLSLTDKYLEAFDAITVDGQLMLVKEATYDPSSFTQNIVTWSSVLAGTNTAYVFAFPASASSTERFGQAVDVTAPSLNIGYGGVGIAVNDTGDEFPSDTGDVCCTPPTTGGCEPYVPSDPAYVPGNRGDTFLNDGGVNFDHGDPDPVAATCADVTSSEAFQNFLASLVGCHPPGGGQVTTINNHVLSSCGGLQFQLPSDCVSFTEDYIGPCRPGGVQMVLTIAVNGNDVEVTAEDVVTDCVP